VACLGIAPALLGRAWGPGKSLTFHIRGGSKVVPRLYGAVPGAFLPGLYRVASIQGRYGGTGGLYGWRVGSTGYRVRRRVTDMSTIVCPGCVALSPVRLLGWRVFPFYSGPLPFTWAGCSLAFAPGGVCSISIVLDVRGLGDGMFPR